MSILGRIQNWIAPPVVPTSPNDFSDSKKRIRLHSSDPAVLDSVDNAQLMTDRIVLSDRPLPRRPTAKSLQSDYNEKILQGREIRRNTEMIEKYQGKVEKARKKLEGVPRTRKTVELEATIAMCKREIAARERQQNAIIDELRKSQRAYQPVVEEPKHSLGLISRLTHRRISPQERVLISYEPVGDGADLTGLGNAGGVGVHIPSGVKEIATNGMTDYIGGAVALSSLETYVIFRKEVKRIDKTLRETRKCTELLERERLEHVPAEVRESLSSSLDFLPTFLRPERRTARFCKWIPGASSGASGSLSVVAQYVGAASPFSFFHSGVNALAHGADTWRLLRQNKRHLDLFYTEQLTSPEEQARLHEREHIFRTALAGLATRFRRYGRFLKHGCNSDAGEDENSLWRTFKSLFDRFEPLTELPEERHLLQERKMAYSACFSWCGVGTTAIGLGLASSAAIGCGAAKAAPVLIPACATIMAPNIIGATVFNGVLYGKYFTPGLSDRIEQNVSALLKVLESPAPKSREERAREVEQLKRLIEVIPKPERLDEHIAASEVKRKVAKTFRREGAEKLTRSRAAGLWLHGLERNAVIAGTLGMAQTWGWVYAMEKTHRDRTLRAINTTPAERVAALLDLHAGLTDTAVPGPLDPPGTNDLFEILERESHSRAVILRLMAQHVLRYKKKAFTVEQGAVKPFFAQEYRHLADLDALRSAPNEPTLENLLALQIEEATTMESIDSGKHSHALLQRISAIERASLAPDEVLRDSRNLLVTALHESVDEYLHFHLHQEAKVERGAAVRMKSAWRTVAFR